MRAALKKLKKNVRESGRSIMQSSIKVEERYEQLRDRIRAKRPDDLAGRGYKVYSQNDEDGIIAEIFAALGFGSTFIEIGVENGRECNTHLLALKGWRGAWIEGSPTMCEQIESDLGGRAFGNRFLLREAMVDKTNIASLYKEITAALGVERVDFFSLDIDGNDLFVLEEMLRSCEHPPVLCVEYNGKFPPPLAISVAYDENRNWGHDDHFGASLQAFYDMLTPFGYTLITCNVTGANAFFVKDEHAAALSTGSPEEVWQPLRLQLCPLPGAHRPSLGFLRETVAQS